MAKDQVKKRLAVNPEEAMVVELIYSWYLAGLGAKAIAQRLNEEGQLYRGKRWLKNRILDIIGDEAYAGVYFFNKRDKRKLQDKPREEWVPIEVPRIIDQVTWERAKALKGERYPGNPRANPAVTGSRTLLTGLAVCGLCGANMTMETARGGRFVYYNCANFIRKGRSTCPGQRVPAKKVEAAILEHLAGKLFTKERVRAIIKGLQQEMQELNHRHREQRRGLRRQLEGVNLKISRQCEAIESGAIDLTLVGGRLKELHALKANLEERLNQVQPAAIPIRLFTDKSIEAFQRILKDMFLGPDRVLTKRYLRLFIEKLVITLPKVEIFGKTEALMAVLQNSKAVKTPDGVLTAVNSWLPGTDSNRRPSG
jgi:site-specific DNA recombinase